MKQSYILFLLAFGFLSFTNVQAQKTDSIYHINGNILTGDFKKLAYGIATYKMSGMGTVNIDQYVINSIKSKKIFEVRVKQGWVYYGSLDTSWQKRKVNVVSEGTRQLIEIPQILEIYPIQNNLWKRLSGNFGLGFEYSKGSDIGKFNANGRINYRKRKTNLILSWDHHFTFEKDSVISSKSNSLISYERLLKRYWSFGSFIGTTQNSELGTKSRVFLSTIIIRDILYTNTTRFYVGAGLVGGPEWKYNTNGYNNTLSGIMVLNWDVFKLSSPEIKLESQISYQPYITESNRHIVTAKIYPHLEIVNNLNFGFKFYYELDTKPDNTEIAKSDWGINVIVSYSFH